MLLVPGLCQGCARVAIRVRRVNPDCSRIARVVAIIYIYREKEKSLMCIFSARAINRKTLAILEHPGTIGVKAVFHPG
jgi:hypothetical protein